MILYYFKVYLKMKLTSKFLSTENSIINRNINLKREFNFPKISLNDFYS